MKKILSFFLCVYIIALTITPCVDYHPDAACGTAPVIAVNDLSSHQEDADHCSPFCTCACCGLSVDVTQIFIIPAVKADYQTVTSYLPSRLCSCFSFSIWEPPKSLFA